MLVHVKLNDLKYPACKISQYFKIGARGHILYYSELQYKLLELPNKWKNLGLQQVLLNIINSF